MKKLIALTFILVLSLAAACGHDHDNNHDHNHANNDHNHDHNDDHNHDHNDDHNHDHNDHGHSPQEEGCEHMDEGPFNNVAAAADDTGALEAISDTHTRHDVTLVELTDMAGSYAGYVEFEATEEGDYYFFLSADVPFEVQGGDLESTGDVSECDEVVKEFVYELSVGTYTVYIGPTTETAVGIVVEFEDDHDHGHDH